jgi:hypothetical protein
MPSSPPAHVIRSFTSSDRRAGTASGYAAIVIEAAGHDVLLGPDSIGAADDSAGFLDDDIPILEPRSPSCVTTRAIESPPPFASAIVPRWHSDRRFDSQATPSPHWPGASACASRPRQRRSAAGHCDALPTGDSSVPRHCADEGACGNGAPGGQHTSTVADQLSIVP